MGWFRANSTRIFSLKISTATKVELCTKWMQHSGESTRKLPTRSSVSDLNFSYKAAPRGFPAKCCSNGKTRQECAWPFRSNRRPHFGQVHILFAASFMAFKFSSAPACAKWSSIFPERFCAGRRDRFRDAVRAVRNPAPAPNRAFWRWPGFHLCMARCT